MKKIIGRHLLAFIFLALIFTPILVFAQSSSTTSSTNPILNTLQQVGNKGGYITDPAIASPVRIVGLVVRLFINFLGVTFIILMVFAGYGWMTAGGNEEKVKKSRTMIVQALVGLLVAVVSWTLWNFIFEKIILMQ